MPDPKENPFTSIRAAIAFHPGDWSKHHREAWIYGIVVGWGVALPEVAKFHEWKPEEVRRLERLHEIYNRVNAEFEPPAIPFDLPSPDSDQVIGRRKDGRRIER